MVVEPMPLKRHKRFLRKHNPEIRGAAGGVSNGRALSGGIRSAG